MADTGPEVAWRRHLYLQTRLKEKNGRIRLLTIQPRQYTVSRPESPPSTIHCFLRLAELKERPPFTVVSHRWHVTDTVDDAKSVLVNGAPIPVSTDLFEILQSLQRESDPVVTWIDALCINHADEDAGEKSVQLAQLPRIYATAEKTFIWLGGTADRSDEAMKVLRRLAEEQLTLSAYLANWTPQLGLQLVQRILPSGFIPSATPTAEPVELQKELESLREPLKALMERTYWTDLWSLVELCLSPRGLVVCGNHGLSLDHFYSAARALDHIINHLLYSKWLASATHPSTGDTQSAVLRSEEVSNLSQSSALRMLARRDEYRWDAMSWVKSPDKPLFTLLNGFYAETKLSLRTSDPRDRIYALACLASDITELGLTVDYSKAIKAIYTETSAAFLRKYPRVLQLAQGTANCGDDDEEETSWAIDWEHVKPPLSDLRSSERPFNACGLADIRYYRAETGISGQIALKAAVVDTVKEIGTPYQLADEPEKHTESLRTLLSEIKTFWEESTASISSPYFAEQAAVALAKIPVGDMELSALSSSGGFTRASSATILGYKKTFEALFPDTRPDSPETESRPPQSKESDSGLDTRYITAITRMAGRKPFLSQGGYIGLGPSDLAVGDTITIPYGSTVPIALRRMKKGEDEKYRLVGEVYVFGIMDGEFMKVHRQEAVLRIV
ncbi:heterokaryon incompatibility protein-domain-containing protein [Xylaria sp. CBS 124048]|nr:heterokaryon incompatibility protein-domain-containing protein [Xylaria sp. CBS 124048]